MANELSLHLFVFIVTNSGLEDESARKEAIGQTGEARRGSSKGEARLTEAKHRSNQSLE